MESLKGRKRKKYQDAHYDELRDYYAAEQELECWEEKDKYPTDSEAKAAVEYSQKMLAQKQAEHDAVHEKYKELFRTQTDFEAFLHQYSPQTQQQEEQQYQQQKEQQKKKKRDVLE